MSVSPNEVKTLPEVVMTPELQAAINSAVSATDLRGMFIAEAEKQLATKTQLDADQEAATQAAAAKVAADQAAAEAAEKANQTFTRTEVIGGKEFHFEAASELEIERQVLNAYKVAYNVQQPVERVEPVIDQAAQAAAAEAEVLAKADLERKFRLGEISAADYIQQSGAVNDYLATQGLSVETLKTVVEKNRTDSEVQSWASASDEFRNSSVGGDWPGGEKNRMLLGDKLAAMGLTDATDKVAALAQAWQAMKSTGAYFPAGDAPVVVTPAQIVADPAEAARIAKASADATAAVEAARLSAAAKARSTSSSLFGASSGTSGAPVVNPAVVAAKQIVPDNADPREIMEAWKAAQLANGQNPDEALKSVYASKRI
jgi:hypothetical protein